MTIILSRALQILLVPLAVAVLQGCSGTGNDNKDPLLTAEPGALSAEERLSANALAPEDVASITANRKKVSCIELAMGSAQTAMPEAAAVATTAPAADAAPAAAATPSVSSTQLIDDEAACHCQYGAPMPGYELYERRGNLLKLAKSPEIRAELNRYYPKGEKGAPRFLRYGEKISDDTLKNLPVVAPRLRPDNCDSKCKDGRALQNSKAKAEGQPEPWPNLERSARMACVASPVAAKNSKAK